jgi:hypothetical protein
MFFLFFKVYLRSKRSSLSLSTIIALSFSSIKIAVSRPDCLAWEHKYPNSVTFPSIGLFLPLIVHVIITGKRSHKKTFRLISFNQLYSPTSSNLFHTPFCIPNLSQSTSASPTPFPSRLFGNGLWMQYVGYLLPRLLKEGDWANDR